MTQATNPLIAARKVAPVRDLDAYAEWVNSLNWVRGSGFRYYVRQRVGPEGEVERFLDRMDARV